MKAVSNSEATLNEQLPAIQSGKHIVSTPWAVTWLTWPTLFGLNMILGFRVVGTPENYANVLTILLLMNVVALTTIEFLFPLESRWKMNWRSFLRDLKYIVGGSVSFAVIDGLFGLASIRLNTGHVGPLTSWPMYLSVPAALLAVEFLNYWQHRWSHELNGTIGDHLWKIHVAHHLPEQVYVLMHPAVHPVNAFVVRGLVTLLPLYFLGAGPETVLFVTIIVTLQGLVSHCNVDLRTGWLNYVLAGTELHRFHHSADLTESKNYAVTLSILDLIFGTFYYRPGTVPTRIGVLDPNAYPNSNEFWKVMKLPLHRGSIA
jgi:sterol desaturase/sphingolipid hydroxylase (fatty acid hydroxylase superfamily)